MDTYILYMFIFVITYNMYWKFLPCCHSDDDDGSSSCSAIAAAACKALLSWSAFFSFDCSFGRNFFFAAGAGRNALPLQSLGL